MRLGNFKNFTMTNASLAPTATAARVYGSNDAHWYASDGTPKYEVPKADGKGMRKTTITDAKKHGWLPSVTTILGEVLAKPQLTAWLCEQAALAVLTAPKAQSDEPVDLFVKRVLQTERQQDQERDTAAALGTAVHNVFERLLAGEKFEYAAQLKPYIECVLALPLLKGRVVCTEKCIVGPGFAGKYDCEIDNEEPFLDLLDFKTAKTMPTVKTGSWDEHVLQLAAYAHARTLQGNLGNKKVRCWNVYISTREPGQVLALENIDWEAAYHEGFQPLVRHWQWRKQYFPK